MKNPAAKLKPPTEPKQIGADANFLSKKEAKQLVKALPKDNSLQGLRDRLLLALMLIEGCRQIELHRLNFGDIVPFKGQVGIKVNGKRSIRMIPLNKDVAKLLDRYLKARRKKERLLLSAPLFVNLSRRGYGGRLTRRSMARIANKYLEEAKLKYQQGRKISPHGLRHTTGFLSQLSGASLRETQDFLGHSDPKITAIYAHLASFWERPPGSRLGIKI